MDQIKLIDPNTFNGLSVLKSIDFRNNEIKILDPSIFDGLIELQVIEFSDNQNRSVYIYWFD